MYLWIGFVHMLISPLIPILCILLVPKRYHSYLFVYLILIVLLWLPLKDECAFSFAYKKLNDPSYSLGDTIELKDIMDVYTYLGIEHDVPSIYISILKNMQTVLYCVFILYLFTNSIVPATKLIIFSVLLFLYLSVLYLGSSGKYGNGKNLFSTNEHLRTAFDILKIPYAAILIYIALV